MQRKPLEGIDSLLFVLGAGFGCIIVMQNYSWWVILLAIIIAGIIVGKFVEFLREKNHKN